MALTFSKKNKAFIHEMEFNRAMQIDSILRAVFCMWILLYYFLPQTIWARIALGGQLSQISLPLGISLGLSIGLTFINLFTFAKSRDNSKYPPIWLLTCFYFLAIYFSLFNRFENSLLVKDSINFINSLSFGMLIPYILKSKLNIPAFLSCSGAIQAFYTLYYNYIGVNQLQSGSMLRAGGTFNHPEPLYILMLVVIPFSIISVMRSRNALQRLLFMIITASQISALILTWYRGAVLAFSASILYFIWLNTKNKKIINISIPVLLCLIFTTWQIRSYNDISIQSTRRSDLGHVFLVKEGVKLFSQNAFTGVGISNVSIRVQTLAKNKDYFENTAMTDPKNLFLFILCEMGIAGGILFITFFLKIREIIKKKILDIHDQNRDLYIATASSWLSIMIASIFETPFSRIDTLTGNFCFGILLGITVIFVRKD